MNWDDLIARRDKWVAYNFPTQTGTGIDSVFGVIEEIGELTHAYLKNKQGIRGNENHIENMKDSIGDATVYLLGVMSRHDRQPVLHEWRPSVHMQMDEAILHCGMASGALAQRFMDRSLIGFGIDRVVKSLMTVCHVAGWDYDAIVTETWNMVERRDWIKYPDTGKPPTDGDGPPSQDIDYPDMTETVPTGGSPETGSNLHGKPITGQHHDEVPLGGTKTGRFSCRDPH